MYRESEDEEEAQTTQGNLKNTQLLRNEAPAQCKSTAPLMTEYRDKYSAIRAERCNRQTNVAAYNNKCKNERSS